MERNVLQILSSKGKAKLGTITMFTRIEVVSPEGQFCLKKKNQQYNIPWMAKVGIKSNLDKDDYNDTATKKLTIHPLDM